MVEYEAVASAIRSFARERVDAADADGVVLGVSGGLDSAVAARLLADALGPDRVTGLVMPGAPSDPEHMADARWLCRDLELRWREHSIEPLVDSVEAVTPAEAGRTTTGNVRARARKLLEYRAANREGRLVVGADNRSEYQLGYFTKYGDGACDFRVLSPLYKLEVYDLAEHLGVDGRFVEKTPTAGLWEGQTDAGELGAPYEVVDPVLRELLDRGASVAAAARRTDTDEALVRRLADRHESSAHKRSTPPAPEVPIERERDP
ncbi:MAG: NAD+ synthase [Haloarculaceae archaeon]